MSDIQSSQNTGYYEDEQGNIYESEEAYMEEVNREYEERKEKERSYKYMAHDYSDDEVSDTNDYEYDTSHRYYDRTKDPVDRSSAIPDSLEQEDYAN